MDDLASDMIDRATQLADFDHARDDFEQAFAQVPPEALDYKPEGDDYSLRDIVTHVANSMIMYNSLLDELARLQNEEVRLVATGEFDPAVQTQRIRERSSLPIRNPERTGSLDQMEAVHDALAARLRAMEHEEYSRRTPVYFAGSEAADPTAASDIIGWLIDHYREHVEQVNQMLDEYNKSGSKS